MLDHLRTLLSRDDQDGASAVEYGLLVAGIAAVIVLLVFALGGVIQSAFSTTCTSVTGKVTSSGQTCS